MKDAIEISEYKGHKIIKLPLDDEGKAKFSFGLRKAKCIVKHIKDIESFIKGADDVK